MDSYRRVCVITIYFYASLMYFYASKNVFFSNLNVLLYICVLYLCIIIMIVRCFKC